MRCNVMKQYPQNINSTNSINQLQRRFDRFNSTHDWVFDLLSWFQ